MNHRHLIAAVALAALSPFAVAQVEGQRIAAPAPEPRSAVHDIARWIDDSIFGVMVIDIHKADLPGAINQLAASVDRVEEGGRLTRDELDRLKKDVVDARKEVEQWLAEYKAAGGGEVWFLMSPQPAVCFLTNEGADIDVLKEMIGKLEFAEREKPIFRRGVIIAGSKLRGLPVEEAAPERVAQLKAALDAARTASTDTPVVRQAFIPTDAHRLLLSGLITHLTQMTEVKVAQDLNTKITWAAAAVSSIPNPEVFAVVQTTGGQPAQQVAALANALMAEAAKEVPAGPLVEVLRELRFMANEDRAELRISTAMSRRVTESLVTPLVAARESARRVKAMSMTREQLTAVHLFAADHEDTLPASLDDLKKYLAGSDLQHPEGRGWVYRRPVATLARMQNPARVVILHETYTKWPEKGLVVGFADGHVELITNEDDFKERLEAR